MSGSQETPSSTASSGDNRPSGASGKQLGIQYPTRRAPNPRELAAALGKTVYPRPSDR